jgi:Tol biopolymer transport system component
VHGDRIAYRVERGDSVDLMLTIGASGGPRRLATFSEDGDAVTWSWDGTRIAVADWLPGTPRRGGVGLITIQADGTPAPDIRRFDLGVENGCDQFQWTPDDSHIVMLCYGTSGRIMKLRLSDGQLRTVLPSETPQEVWEYYLSPDGRQVVYPVQSDAGSSVHVFDLKPLLERAR